MEVSLITPVVPVTWAQVAPISPVCAVRSVPSLPVMLSLTNASPVCACIDPATEKNAAAMRSLWATPRRSNCIRLFMFYGKETRMFLRADSAPSRWFISDLRYRALPKIKPAISFNASSGLLKFLEFPKSLRGIRYRRRGWCCSRFLCGASQCAGQSEEDTADEAPFRNNLNAHVPWCCSSVCLTAMHKACPHFIIGAMRWLPLAWCPSLSTRGTVCVAGAITNRF